MTLNDLRLSTSDEMPAEAPEYDHGPDASALAEISSTFQNILALPIVIIVLSASMFRKKGK